MHILVECSYVRRCWEKIGISISVGVFLSFQEWLQQVFQQRQCEDIEKIATMCWMLWKSRNDLVWNQCNLDENKVVESACSVLSQWKSVQDKTFNRFMGFMTQDDGHERWEPPGINKVKINSDAAIFAESSYYSYAFVIRNHDGELVEARSKCSYGQVSPELAEAIGIREALSWVKNMAVQKEVEVESDCLQIVQAIRSSFSSLSYLGRVAEECKTILASLRDQNVVFRFVKRSANRVAHCLARYSCSIADRSWKLGDVHPDFYHVLLNDLKS